MRKLLFWPYRFQDMKEGWREQTLWLANSFKKQGYNILRHKNFICRGLQARVYEPERDRNSIHTVVYNHTDKTRLIGNIVPSQQNIFFKPTVPTPRHTTIDPLGYGPFSSITFYEPDYKTVFGEEEFFETKVQRWIQTRSSKWAKYQSHEVDIPHDGYYLVLGQCGGDSVVTEYDFGGYWMKLKSIVRELLRVGDREVVVKLHPYTDGKDATDDKFSAQKQRELAALGDQVSVYRGKSDIHSFLRGAHCVLLANSGAGIEAMMHHKPIIAWGHPEYHWTSYDLRHLAELQTALNLRWFNQQLQDKWLYWYCEKYCFYNQETCDYRVAQIT